MDYSDYDEEPASGGWKTWLKWGLILGGGPLLLLMAVGGFAAWVGTPEQQFDQMIDRDPATRPVMAAMRKHFPDEYAAFRRTMLPHVERGAPQEQIAAFSSDFMQAFTSRHRWEVARAPDAPLTAFMAAQLATFEKLSAQSQQACGALAFGRGLLPGAANKDNAALLGTLSVRFIEAAAAGRDDASGRSAASTADRQQLGQKLLAAGLRGDVRRLMERDAPPVAYTEDQMCYLSLSILRALTKLPPPVALRVHAEIVQSS